MRLNNFTSYNIFYSPDVISSQLIINSTIDQNSLIQTRFIDHLPSNLLQLDPDYQMVHMKMTVMHNSIFSNFNMDINSFLFMSGSAFSFINQNILINITGNFGGPFTFAGRYPNWSYDQDYLFNTTLKGYPDL